jgi:3-oxoacyl-[acyl-carrier protein] reductase
VQPTPAADRRVALVMAASRGLGRGCAEALADAGLALAVCARRREPLDQVVADLRGRGAPAVGLVADVATAEGVDAVVSGAREAFGGVDVLVANAGGPPLGDFLSLGEDDWRTGYELTLMSAVRAMRACLPGMAEAGFGRIVVVGSSSVRSPIDGLVVSNAFRPALLGVVKSVAGEFAARGVTVNMVSPGRIQTDRSRAADEAAAARRGVGYEQARQDSEAAIPMGRYGTPAELGALVAFLASGAAGYITGQSILVDGGLVRCLP